MLDTDKVGVVAYLWQQAPFSETQMANVSGLTFSKTLTGQTPGATISYAVKFAYAGGLSVTKYVSYVVGDNCDGGGTDTEAPTNFTASVGTITSTSVELLLNGTDDSGTVVYDIAYGANTTSVTGESGVQKSITISNLTPETVYSFSIEASDASGNEALNNAIVLEATTLADSNTACAGTSSEAQDGAFSTGYSYAFETVGTDVTATFEMLDTDKVGVVAYLWQQAPFVESQMTNVSGLTFSKTLTGQTPGATINMAVKFAYAGGLAVTKYFTYTVGEDCDLGIDDNEFNNSITMYPNPATSILNIDSKLTTVSKVELYSVLGSKVLETNESKINIENLSSGIYLVKIYAGTKSVTKKLVVR